MIQATFKMHKIMIPKEFLEEIYDNYNNNPFHNIKHAYEVFETMHNLLHIVNVKKQFTNVDKTILLITALCHDINHQGKTNKILKQESYTSMVELCQEDENDEILPEHITIERNRSYDDLFDVETFDAFNEKTHLEITMNLINKYRVFERKMDVYVENFVQSLILCTDLNLHDTYLEKFDASNKFSLGILLMKIADLSHPTRDFRVHLYWVYKLKQELGLDRTTVEDIAADTLGFIAKYLYPLLQKLNEHYSMNTYIRKLEKNTCLWQRYITI
jgi:hypothetical protein